jgi:hypothetical protein
LSILEISVKFFFSHAGLAAELLRENLLHCRETARARARGSLYGARERKVAEEKPKVTNEISDETGQHDARFLLWRRFCSDNGIPVETMPGDLSGEAKQKWEKLKANLLPKSMNK